MRKFAKRMLYLLAGLYLALLILSFFSDSLIFLPHPSSYQDAAGILKLATRNGKKISAVYLDTVIPAWHGRKLFALANEPKRFVEVHGADHNDLDSVAGKAYAATLQEFAGSISGHPAAKSTPAL